MMEAAIHANAQLDFIEFQIFPFQNRYEAFVYCVNKKEQVTSGILEHLCLHSPEVKALNLKGSTAKYKLTPPGSIQDVNWFTKSTLIRFLCITGSPNIPDISNSAKNEIFQLEEARKFHLSLYAMRTSRLQNGESDDYCNSTRSTPIAESSDASKNELLRAIDLRLAALAAELTAAFSQASSSTLSVDELADIEKFSDHFGSIDLRDSLHKHIELIQRNQVVDNSHSNQVMGSDSRITEKEGNNQNSKLSSSDMPPKYGASPAKVAQLERLSSTETDESSSSSEDEQPSADRSRSLLRSASPRRSASPMRRIQIGRSGSRRPTAVAIKSLNNIPARERSFLLNDPIANDSDEEESEQVPKKSENNVTRMSVQAAINLFESKQKNEIVDIQKAKLLLNVSTGANKSVLRRWSSCTGEHSSQKDIISEGSVPQDQNSLVSDANKSPEAEPELRVAFDYHPVELPEMIMCSPLVLQEETLPTESGNVNEKLTASAEWSRQKEAELNELLMKMMETKPVKSWNVVPDSSKRQSLPGKQRGGLYDNCNEKRDEKLRETVKSKGDKDKQFKAVQQVLVSRKSQLTPANTSDVVKKPNVNRLQRLQKTASQPANRKIESPKLGVVKKASTKAPSLPATRKSWPSPRAPGALSTAKTPVSMTSTSSAPTCRRSQLAPPVSQSSPKVETSGPQTKPVKSNQTLRTSTEKKQDSATKPSKSKIVKNKVQAVSEESAPSAKPSLYIKVTKKGSVVPLESKPFLRKGSGTFSGGNPKIKASSDPQEPMKKPEDAVRIVETDTVSSFSDPVIQHQESEVKEVETHTGMDSGTSTNSPEKCEDQHLAISSPKKKKSSQGDDEETFSSPVKLTNNSVDMVMEPHELKADIEEESTISPTAWVEIEENLVSSEHLCQMDYPAFVAPVGVSSPRVRHSLSQMLLEESSEPDIIDWENAENPPPMIYQKDAPKGFKRLLKFARMSKTDASSTGFSSPSVFSEGEDDTDNLKLISKRSAENLLKKVTLHSTNNEHQKIGYDTYRMNSTDPEHPAEANIAKFKNLSQQLLEGYASSASGTTTKATRSFFSLSAFKGSK